jgi:hypothetical protein
LIALASGEDWLWRPVLAGLCRAESIFNSDLDLEAIAVLNELLDVRAVNERIMLDDQRRHQPSDGEWRGG